MHKQGEYVRTSIRLYNPDAYEKFFDICKQNYTSATQELNRYIMEVAENGAIPGRKHAAGQ